MSESVRTRGWESEPQWVEVREGNRFYLRRMKKVGVIREYLPYRRAIVTGKIVAVPLTADAKPDTTPTFTVEEVPGWTEGETEWVDA